MVPLLKLQHFLSDREAKSASLCLEQGQGFIESAEPPYPKILLSTPPLPPFPQRYLTWWNRCSVTVLGFANVQISANVHTIRINPRRRFVHWPCYCATKTHASGFSLYYHDIAKRIIRWNLGIRKVNKQGKNSKHTPKAIAVRGYGYISEFPCRMVNNGLLSFVISDGFENPSIAQMPSARPKLLPLSHRTQWCTHFDLWHHINALIML